MLASQLALLLIRDHQRRQAGRPLAGDGALRRRALAALPFALTGAQRRAIAEIEADLARPLRMLRLVQGDVGSGKTVVAFFAMLIAVESGRQAALMAPTELLARQHHETIAPLAAALGLDVVLLTGRDKGRARREALARLADGGAKLAIGTHALFQEEVAFADLALAVIDEQHRFGVQQRLALAGKGDGVHILVTTATPIPRTLMLCSYGDMENSRLDEKPPGRQPVDTRVLPLDRIDEVVAGLSRQAGRGGKAYWVCPLVAESEEVDLAAATERARVLGEVLGPDRVALLHGRMKPAEKDAAMARFAGGDAAVLVATTVIEVGVDVPAPSCTSGAGGAGAPPPRPPACCSIRRPSARSRSRALRSCARPRTVSGSPRRICGCAAPARCWARARAEHRISGSPISPMTATCWPWRGTKPG
jgi:ATP-dependent DNA helicase RecG